MWQWSARSGALAGCVWLGVLPLREGFAAVHARAGELKVTLLSIGAGQCAVVEPPGGAEAVLIDAGSTSLSDLQRKALGPFLRHAGRRDVGAIFISHSNYDHFSAVSEVVGGYDVGQVYVSSQFRMQSIDNLPAEHLLRTLDAMDLPPREIAIGHGFDIGGGAKLAVVWPPEQYASDPNNCSLVLSLTYAGRRVLFTGDLETAGQRELLASGQDLRADVLLAPHHGSYEHATTMAFIDTVSPSYIVCSNDRTLSARQREFDRQTRGRNVLRTHAAGAITVRITRAGEVKVEPFLKRTD
jgi:beta-lactamase superfamily II metal-dependent hydrolase